jgi:RHS repeat-associated protein
MNTTINIILSTSPSTLSPRKPRLTARALCRRTRPCLTGKEQDSETGLYYYGARYLDPRAGRWLSGDPAVGEYIPSAPVNEEARKRNGSLPGMGGVFNYANLHVYHYAGNNPVKYTDPDGNSSVDKFKNFANSVDQFIFENKEALLTIAVGGALIAAGNLLKGGSVGGGVAIAGLSGGLGAPAGVAVAVAGVGAGAVLEATGTITVATGLAMLANNNNYGTGGGRGDYREKTRGANANDRQQIESVAREAGIDKNEFGKFIQEMKKVERRGPSDNFKYDELRDLAKQFKEL